VTKFSVLGIQQIWLANRTYYGLSLPLQMAAVLVQLVEQAHLLE